MAIHDKPNVNSVFSANGTNTVKPNAENGYVVGDIPKAEEHNHQFNKNDNMDKHINEAGLPEWDNITSYSIGSYVGKVVDNSPNNRRIYISKTDLNVGNVPETSSANWQDVTEKYLTAGYTEAVGINALTATVDFPNVIAYNIGQKFYIKIENNNTNALVTLNINNIGNVELVNNDNSALEIGQLTAGSIYGIIYAEITTGIFKFKLINISTKKGTIVQQIEQVRTTQAVILGNLISSENPKSNQGNLFIEMSYTPLKLNNLLVLEAYISSAGYQPIFRGTTRPLSAFMLVSINDNNIDNSLSLSTDNITDLRGRSIYIKTTLKVENLNATTYSVKASRISNVTLVGYLNRFSSYASKSFLRITEIEQ